jgi:hypothetical protein
MQAAEGLAEAVGTARAAPALAWFASAVLLLVVVVVVVIGS